VRHTHHIARADRINQAGSITLGVSVGRHHYRTRVLVLVHDLDVRIIHAATGALLRELTLDPTRDYQPTGASKGPKRNGSEPKAGSEPLRCPETSPTESPRIRTCTRVSRRIRSPLRTFEASTANLYQRKPKGLRLAQIIVESKHFQV
jgi:hypothetical protein